MLHCEGHQKSSRILSQPSSISTLPLSLFPAVMTGFFLVTTQMSPSFINPNKLQAPRQIMAWVLLAFNRFQTWGRHKQPCKNTHSTSVDVAITVVKYLLK